MQGGWYCRSMANEQATQNEETTDHSGSDADDAPSTQTNQMATTNATDYKEQYRYLKRKLKFLIYENEFFQDALRSNQRRLLKVSRDRAFLLDRLLQYERPENTSSDSDETESSDEEPPKETKKRKTEQNATTNGAPSGRGRKKKNANAAGAAATEQSTNPTPTPNAPLQQEEQQVKLDSELPEEHQPGHMTPAEVERHLQSRQPVIELIPERTPATVPAEMFSNEPSLDSEPNEHHMLDGSPTHVAAEECVAMEYCN